MPGSRECPVPSPFTHVEIRCALGGTNSESASISGEKSSYLFNIPDAQLCNITVGILDTKRSLLDRWRTLAICWKLLKTAFFCKSHATSLPAVCRVLGNVRQLHPKDPGPIPKSTTIVLTALRLSAAEKQGKLTNEHLGQRDH